MRPDGTLFDDKHTIPPQAFPMAAMTAPDSVPHICPRLGESEVWEVVNTTSELHNFHLHQVKFRLSVQTDPGAPPDLNPIVDPTGIIAKYMPEVQGASPKARADLFHDTLPIPPADAKGNAGKLFITVPFYAREQIGTYVMHCHILAHEDGGMMAVVEGYDPGSGEGATQ